MTQAEAVRVLLDQAMKANPPVDHYHAIATDKARPASLRDYRQASFEASARNHVRLGQAVRRVAREDLLVLRKRGKGVGREAWDLRSAAGLPTEAEDYAEHGTFFPPAG